ncbi:MAG: 3-phosphoshikimate 1-carboxyvinyltransferase, partial [Bacteroidota bacterium]
MIAIVHPSRIAGTLCAPRSKSDMQRACAAALLHQGVTHIIDPGKSNDDLAALDVISKLGAEVAAQDNTVVVKSKGVHPFFDEINCGESGLGIRMFTPIASLSSKELTISGTGSLLSRPMHFFDAIFPRLAISIHSNAGRLPLVIKGPMLPSSIEVDGSLSSQFLTGLLMAYSAAGATDVTITVKDLKSKPYIDLTLGVLTSFGMKVPVVKDYETFTFSAVDHVQPVGEISYLVEGDWSGASFLFVAGAIAGGISIQGMKADSVQADMKILEAIKDAGASLRYEDGVYHVG